MSGSPLDSLYDFRVRPDFTPSENSPFYVEYFWNLEKASKSDHAHLISLITPMTQDSFSPTDASDLINFYFFNKKASEFILALIRNAKTHKIEGYFTYIVMVEYFLPNNFTKENEYSIISGFTLVDRNIRNKGIYEVIVYLYIYPYSIKNIGKNLIFLDVAVNPVTFNFLSQNYILLPSYYRQIPRLALDFILKLIQKYEYTSISDDKPFVVKDVTLADVNIEAWRKNYNKLSRNMKFYIDQTELKPGYGLLFAIFGNLLQGNTLKLPCTQFYFDKKLPDLLFKEYSFDRPRL